MEEKIFLENFERKKKSIGLIHKVYLAQLKSSRKYTACTKTKSEVRGGGKKPWRQKGTGQARAGSTRSPLWVGGGVSFGPKPRTVSKKINKKERRLAILSAIYLKKKELVFLDEGIYDEFSNIKTKNILSLLSNLRIKTTSRILFVLTKPNHDFWLATRNLKNIQVTTATSLNIEQILKTNHILLSNQGLELINSTYGKSYT
jgi:large subunit ribosomal protein L4|tara:strand:+ start:2708 stop:3313 length:606 start_codon:yes stop_codon:yes gene_type:complete